MNLFVFASKMLDLSSSEPHWIKESLNIILNPSSYTALNFDNQRQAVATFANFSHRVETKKQP